MAFIFKPSEKVQSPDRPVRVGLIGAGKFGSMFLAQVPTTIGLMVTAIADLSIDRARDACRNVGWNEEQIARVRFGTDAMGLIESDDVDVVVEATGHPGAGIRHARASIVARKHIVMVNVEADVLAGPLLAREARDAGVVYTLAYGDQPALVCEMVEWARNCGFEVVAAGKGTRYLPSFHASTPDDVWENRGVNPEDAKKGGMNAQMFNSFIDGTKAAIEMAAVANATGLTPAPTGLAIPPAAADELVSVLNERTLHHRGQVEVVSSVERDGSVIPGNLRWGVYVVFAAPNEYSMRCFREYGVKTDESGKLAALYRPVHLIGLELNVSIFAAALRQESTGCPHGFVADVVATAKRDLAAGEELDGEGGYLVWGKLMPAPDSLRIGALPIGLASRWKLVRPVKQGECLTWDDVAVDGDDDAYQYRRAMEREFGLVPQPA
ncbi:putative homoserine dehydrogenase-like protein [Paraburkholderia sp. BL6665CI2N2]|uniref:NAD(P)H-dependent oxidoreductase n=1 Tax=Paraburkholderia sp. BL6665CI2N2 TaxID=1938806 RepID=UPI0010E240FE|nr:SAF domain-containing protein [Paraburkholderia sp. BL6665CI2N2]TDY22029.1 putative homoserine dehydrogenase-like protein [Paraburkholderia sp. BL6665CI2N2]